MLPDPGLRPKTKTRNAPCFLLQAERAKGVEKGSIEDMTSRRVLLSLKPSCRDVEPGQWGA